MTTVAHKWRPKTRKRGRRQYPIATETELSGFGYEYVSREVSVFEEASDDAIVDWVRELIGTAPAGRTDRLRRFTVAYALWLGYGNRRFLGLLRGIPFYRLPPKTGPEDFLELLVPYPSGNDEKARQARRRQISRDVCAIRYLAESGVTPQEVASLAEEKGEGLDAWSRKASRKLHTPPTGGGGEIASNSGGSNAVTPDTTITITHPASGGRIRWVVSDNTLVRDLMAYMHDLVAQRPDAVATVPAHQHDNEAEE